MLFRICTLFIVFFHSFAYAVSSSKTPIIVYLKGSCCAGKSTLIQSIRQKWESLEIVDEDPIVLRTYPDAVALRFPDKYACIIKAVDQQNLYHALRVNEILFNKTASLEECLNASKAITAVQNELNQCENLLWKQEINEQIRGEVKDAIQLALNSEKNVLIDSWYFTANQIQELFPTTPVVRVMLYCPFPIAYDRLQKRNKESIDQESLLNKRYLYQLMGSFCSLYQFSYEPLQPIQFVDGFELCEVFNCVCLTLENEIVNNPTQIFTFGELTQSQFQDLQAEFMEPFIELETVNLYISPKEKQDLIIDHTEGDIEEALVHLEEVINLHETSR